MDDEALLRAWADGNDGAGEKLYRRHFDALYRFFRTKAPESCEDLIQTTMLECVRSKSNFRGDATFRAFLFGVARHCLWHYLRSQSRDRLEFDASRSSVAACDPRPSTIAARNAEHQRLFEAMRHIPVELQVVLELHYWEDMTTHELAVALDLPQGTVKSRMRRAREALREILESPEFLTSTPVPSEDELATRVRGLRTVLDAC
ncbi:RNA polymerase sigma factor [Paraliomyxa miuraensis]|uniref:RNA polymerase sigma factor n=1 Tax=Paraliomyxa miuraensis TaxID=376150 RepID=UPI002257B6F3|nr:sigma-70 family RNA polymerase sigma factor [Paraliomyxa miuraensis]MCX4243455.1 sigma-70 family RNA polymerase sigma factor [Paraliomyxa miuraensis]